MIISSDNRADRINEEKFNATLRVSLINLDSLLCADMKE